MMVGVGSWFVVDSVGSLLAGLPGNLALNILFLMISFVLLNALRRSTGTLAASQAP